MIAIASFYLLFCGLLTIYMVVVLGSILSLPEGQRRRTSSIVLHRIALAEFTTIIFAVPLALGIYLSYGLWNWYYSSFWTASDTDVQSIVEPQLYVRTELFVSAVWLTIATVAYLLFFIILFGISIYEPRNLDIELDNLNPNRNRLDRFNYLNAPLERIPNLWALRFWWFAGQQEQRVPAAAGPLPGLVLAIPLAPVPLAWLGQQRPG